LTTASQPRAQLAVADRDFSSLSNSAYLPDANEGLVEAANTWRAIGSALTPPQSTQSTATRASLRASRRAERGPVRLSPARPALMTAPGDETIGVPVASAAACPALCICTCLPFFRLTPAPLTCLA
jgi:hypothetical protein